MGCSKDGFDYVTASIRTSERNRFTSSSVSMPEIRLSAFVAPQTIPSINTSGIVFPSDKATAIPAVTASPLPTGLIASIFGGKSSSVCSSSTKKA
jgi:hypothetical protein